MAIEQVWATVDAYLEDKLAQEDDALSATRKSAEEAGMPPINVTPLQGMFLHILARLVGATRALEIGTLAGYSAIWLGRALREGGKLVSIELEPLHAEIARANLRRAGLSGTVEVRVGPALELLPGVAADFGEGAFDLAFIDADKPNNAAYFAWALRLVRPGGVVVVDNVVREGQVADESSTDPAVKGTRQLFQALATRREVPATALQTVGSKGYDGLALALVPEKPA